MDAKGLRQPAQDKQGNVILNFGKTIAGQQSTIELYVKNNLDTAIYEMSPVSSDPDVVITNHPKLLMPGAVERMEIAFKPGKDRRQKLSDAHWGFEYAI